MSGLIF